MPIRKTACHARSPGSFLLNMMAYPYTDSLAHLARAARMPYTIVWTRVRKFGWPVEKALSIPVARRGQKHEPFEKLPIVYRPRPRTYSSRNPNSIAGRARAAGLTVAAVYARLHDGWTLDEALSTPLAPRRSKQGQSIVKGFVLPNERIPDGR